MEDFWNAVDTEDSITGFNIEEFDLPFLCKRSLVNRVKIKALKTQDMRKIINSFFICYQKQIEGKMHDWADLLNIPYETENGIMMLRYFENRNWEKIVAHCSEDVKVEYQIWKILKELNFL